jgi:hypothetical protein
LQHILLQMRFQGEAGFDEYALFTPDSYAEWRAREPDIDSIYEFIIDHLPGESESIRAEIYRRLGNTLP